MRRMCRPLPRAAVLVAATVATAAALAGCGSEPGDLEITNTGPKEVTVRAGDEEFAVSADGGTVLLDYGCTPGDVTVEFASGRTEVVPGPVCPDERIVVTDSGVQLRPSATDEG